MNKSLTWTSGWNLYWRIELKQTLNEQSMSILRAISLSGNIKNLLLSGKA